ncbi:MAG: putative nudix hydrolase YeaB [Anaeromyxobacteraceae bacterium]|nr:putative nudix hydrolase YeaB [Anaeromyxobacteraceae bacterium]
MVVPSLEEIRRALALRPPELLPEPLPRRAAVSIVLREPPSGLEVLFIRRAEREGDLWSGHVAFPGGRVEPGEGIEDAAVRETEEEVGLDLRATGLRLGALDEIPAIGRGRAVGLSIQPWVWELQGEPGPFRLSAEVASAHWVRLGDLLDPARRAPFPYVHEGRSLVLPSLDVDGLVIWGLTYRMIEIFAEVLGAGRRGPEFTPGGAR